MLQDLPDLCIDAIFEYISIDDVINRTSNIWQIWPEHCERRVIKQLNALDLSVLMECDINVYRYRLMHPSLYKKEVERRRKQAIPRIQKFYNAWTLCLRNKDYLSQAICNLHVFKSKLGAHVQIACLDGDKYEDIPNLVYWFREAACNIFNKLEYIDKCIDAHFDGTQGLLYDIDVLCHNLYMWYVLDDKFAPYMGKFIKEL